MTRGWLVLTSAALFLLQPSSSSVSITQVSGRCVGCPYRYELDRMQFVSQTEGWAAATQVNVNNGHVSQYSGLVHTSDAGRTWRPVRGVETFGIDVEPAFSFVDDRRGWIAWTTTSGRVGHLVHTINAGWNWRRLKNPSDGLWVHLHFFDSNQGVGAVSTLDGPQFGETEDGGKTWRFAARPALSTLDYPDQLYFMNRRIGWIAGAVRDGADLRPRLVRTVDGGATWQEASFPKTAIGDPRDLFFLDDQRGWLVLWNTPASTVLETTNGGRTWSETSSWVRAAADGWVYSVRYLSADVGVLVVERQTEGDDSLDKRKPAALVTFDGGRSWARHELPGTVQSCDVVNGEVWCGSGMDLLKIRMRQ